MVTVGPRAANSTARLSTGYNPVVTIGQSELDNRALAGCNQLPAICARNVHGVRASLQLYRYPP
jgi:hypothetical protein